MLEITHPVIHGFDPQSFSFQLNHLQINHPLGIAVVGKFHLNHLFLAQEVNTSLVDNVQNAWNNLLETGQLWAFLIGIGVGWWIRSVLPS
ncbi:MAG: hypothetical protein ACFBSC_21315 [Microcoleaceae cyanobacterium]